MRLIVIEYSTGEILAETDVPVELAVQGPPATAEKLWLTTGTVVVRSVTVQNFAGGQLVTCIVDKMVTDKVTGEATGGRVTTPGG